MSDQHTRVRVIIDIGHQVISIEEKQTKLTAQQAQVLGRLAQTKEGLSPEDLQAFLGVKTPAVASVVISRLRRRLGETVLVVINGCYAIDPALQTEVIGEVKAALPPVARKPPKEPRFKGGAFKLTPDEDAIIQRWANACCKMNNECKTCVDEFKCQRLADKLIGRLIS